MLLAVDIGNSNIVMGIWNGEKWIHQWRFVTHPIRKAGALQSLLQSLFDEKKTDASAISAVIVSSVVPPLTDRFLAALSGLIRVEPLLLNAHTDAGIALGTDQPEQVGADLIADAAGAYGLVKDICMVVDFGTATTVMVVDNPGVLKGGAICAGLKVSVEALTQKTAQLPEIPLEVPASPIGKNTVQTMQSGLVLGHLCMVEGLIDRMKEESGPAKVVATGGFVELLAPHTDYFDYVEPLLTLNGLRLIAERQRANGRRER